MDYIAHLINHSSQYISLQEAMVIPFSWLIEKTQEGYLYLITDLCLKKLPFVPE